MNEKSIPAAIESPAAAPSDTDDIKADFITDATLLDMDGGKSSPRAKTTNRLCRVKCCSWWLTASP